MKTFFMEEALKEAQKAQMIGEVPIGAVVVKNGKIIGRGHNTRESSECVLGHAELNAIKEATQWVGDWRLTNCEIYVTIEPCPMCTGAIFQSRIKSVYFGAYDIKAGACGSKLNLFEVSGLNHYATIESGILEEEARALLLNFFKKKRK